MNDLNDNDSTRDPIAGLLRLAGKRSRPPDDAIARIRARVHADWQVSVARRKRQRWMALAAAVGVLGLVGVLALGLRGGQAPVIVAQREGDSRAIVVGERVQADAVRGLSLRTRAGVARDAVVRLAAGSSLRFESPEQVRLLAGSLYVDTGESGSVPGPHLVVLADQANIEHVGTQFQVRLGAGDVDVAVRTGSVRIRYANQAETLQRGELGVIHTDASGSGAIDRQQVPPSGEPWVWVDGLSPPLAIEGLTLLDALRQLSHEAGLELKFRSPEVEAAARETVLHGPALDLPPARALQAVLATTSLAGETQPDGSTLLIHIR